MEIFSVLPQKNQSCTAVRIPVGILNLDHRFKNARLAFDPDLTTPYKKELYPDQDKLTKDEQHRFELLLAHWM